MCRVNIFVGRQKAQLKINPLNFFKSTLHYIFNNIYLEYYLILLYTQNMVYMSQKNNKCPIVV